jgi:hypothetical protein
LKNLLQIILQGTAGKSFQGDIALDDLLLVDGNCPSDLPFECDFDDESLCGFTNDPTEKHQWIRHKGTNKNHHIFISKILFS